MDKLEEHILKNREDLDRYRPPSGLWKNIKRELKNEKSTIRIWLSIAAMIIVILGSAIVIFNPGVRNPDTDSEGRTDVTLTRVKSQLKETEVYYDNLVNSLYLEAAPLFTGNPEIKKELDYDMSLIDSVCLEIKMDLKDNIANQDVVGALIEKYRIKIRLLEDMLILLKKNSVIPEINKSHEL